MKTAAIYCRVSTISQGKKIATLETQLENCLAYCQGKGYEVAYRFDELSPGVSLQRPELIKLRELVKSAQIDILVIYAMDRLSRVSKHLMILAQELKKYGVQLEVVNETVDDLDLTTWAGAVRAFEAKATSDSV
ncbi:MAG: recombinase family protein [Dehalococcoidia bacterium]